MSQYYLEAQQIGDKLVVVKNNNNGKYVKLGAREYNYLLEVKKEEREFMSHFDFGKDIDFTLNDSMKEILMQKFEEWGFLKDEPQEKLKGLAAKERFKDLSKIPLITLNPEKAVKVTKPLFNVLCSKACVLSVIILGIVSMLLLGFHIDQFAESFYDLKFSGLTFLLVYISIWITTVFHELGHIHVCERNGGKVKKFGIMLFFFSFAFYCDVSDIYMIGSARAKRHVALGGVYINYLVSRIALIAYILLLRNGHNASFLLYYYLMNMSFVLFNLNPFVKLDGYWLLSGICGIDNLMDKCVIFMLSTILDKKLASETKVKGGKKVVFCLYGGAVCIIRPLFWTVAGSSIMKNIGARFGTVGIFVVIFIMAVLVLTDVGRKVTYYKKIYKENRKRVLQMI